MPFPVDKNFIKILQKSGGAEFNLIPFKTILNILNTLSFKQFIKQIIGNIILFIPFGFFMPLLFNKINTIKKILICSISFSLLIELSQLAFSVYLQFCYRYADVDDIIQNSLGGVIGLIILYIARPILIQVIHVPNVYFSSLKKSNVENK